MCVRWEGTKAVEGRNEPCICRNEQGKRRGSHCAHASVMRGERAPGDKDGHPVHNIGWSESTNAPAVRCILSLLLFHSLHTATPSSASQVTGSLQLQATDLSKPVKYGFAVDLA